MSNKSIQDMTIKELKQHLSEADDIRKMLNMATPSGTVVQDDSHWKVGQNYFIRTVTHHHTGRLVKVTPNELVLEDAAWIADDGRFHKCVQEGEVKEVEPFADGDEVIIGRGGLIDAVKWKFPLPRTVK